MNRLIPIIAAVWLAALAAPAQAQSWPCPNGPGPGEIQIGMMGGSGGVGATPLCGSSGEEQDDEDEPRGESRAAPRRPDTWMSAARHPDSPDVWVSTGFASEAGAEADAVGGCTALMGAGCEVQATWSNLSYIAVARNSVGRPYVYGATLFQNLAEQAALEACRKVTHGCTVDRVYPNSPFPIQVHPKSARRSTINAVAWPNGTPPKQWENTVFLESGMGFAAVRGAALARCKSVTGVECMIGHSTADGNSVRYVDGNGQTYWLGASRSDDLVAVLAEFCDVCTPIEQYDTATRRSQTINLHRTVNPMRGYFAIAWPSAASSWPRLAIATARRSNAEADAAAIALCQRESGTRCTLYFDESDAGIQPFVGIYSDSKGNTRTHFGWNAARAAERARASCEAGGVTCVQRAMIDLSRPVTTSLVIR